MRDEVVCVKNDGGVLWQRLEDALNETGYSAADGDILLKGQQACAVDDAKARARPNTIEAQK